MKEDNPLLDYSALSSSNITAQGNAASSSSGSSRTTFTFCKSQANVSWTMVIFVSLAALFYIFFFLLVANTSRAGNLVAFVVAFVGFFVLAIMAVIVMIIFTKEEGFSYQRSSPWIFVLCIIRCTEYMTMMVVTEDTDTLNSIEALTGSWGFFFGLTVVNAIIREYFGEPSELPDTAPNVASNTLRNSTSTLRRSKGFVLSRGPDRGLTPEEAKKIQDRFSTPAQHEPKTKQNTSLTADQYIKAIFGCCIAMTILILLPSDNSWVIVFVKLSTGITVAFGFLLIRQLLGYASNNDGYLLFARFHTNGLVVMALLIAMSARVVLDGIELLSGVDLLHYRPDVNADSFLNFAKEITTELLPIGLHFYNIVQMRRRMPADAGERLKWLIYLVLLTLHFVCIAYVEDSYYGENFGVILATTAGYLAALDFALLLLIILAPITQLFFPIFNFGNLRSRFHRFHFHKKFAYSSFVFALIHVLVHIFTWIVYPNLAVQHNGQQMYSLERPYLYTGILMFIGFIGSIYSGRNPNSKSSDPTQSSNFAYHSIFTVSMVLSFFVHGSGSVLGMPVGDYVIIGVAFLCALIMSFYYAFYPTRKAEVDLQRSVCLRTTIVGHKTKKKIYYLLLVTSNPTHQPVPPGSLFNIFDKRGGSYPFMHAHPFPVFSSSPKRLVFFIRCRFSKSKSNPSFTRMLYKNVGNGSYKSLQLQGPMCGSSSVTSSFIQYLVGVPKVDVYLCGANGGFASVFSLLEHLRGNCNNYNIQSIFCTYHIESEGTRASLHEYVDELVEGWNSLGEAPLVIVETADLLSSIKILSENARAILAHSKRVDGETYILDLLKEKSEKTEASKTEPSEIAHWVALGKDVVENRVTSWDDDVWEDIDEGGVRRKGKAKEAKVREESNGNPASTAPNSESGSGHPTKALYVCGVDLDYEIFGENWKFFNELTSPSYKPQSAVVLEQVQPPKSYQSTNPFQPQPQEVSYQEV